MDNHNEKIPNNPAEEEMSEEQVLEAMFSNLVVQQTRTALYVLGQIPDPHSGERMLDLETAQMLIATLEMLQAKTKGNLSEKESRLIQQSIDQLHDIFQHTIQALEKAQAAKGGKTEAGLFTPPNGIVTPGGESTLSPSLDTENHFSQEPFEQTQSSSSQQDAQPEAAPTTAKSVLTPPPNGEDEDSHKRFSKKY